MDAVPLVRKLHNLAQEVRDAELSMYATTSIKEYVERERSLILANKALEEAIVGNTAAIVRYLTARILKYEEDKLDIQK